MMILSIFISFSGMVLYGELPRIRNLKVGVNIPICKYRQRAINNSKLNIVDHSNYSVIRDVYVYIVFWSGNYVNITKIPSIKVVKKSVEHFQRILNLKRSAFTITIHNICASGKFNKARNLKKLYKFMKNINNQEVRVKLNQSIFPALYVKFKTGTCIIFQNGKYTIVGCESETNVRTIVHKVCAIMTLQ